MNRVLELGDLVFVSANIISGYNRDTSSSFATMREIAGFSGADSIERWTDQHELMESDGASGTHYLQDPHFNTF